MCMLGNWFFQLIKLLFPYKSMELGFTTTYQSTDTFVKMKIKQQIKLKNISEHDKVNICYN